MATEPNTDAVDWQDVAAFALMGLGAWALDGILTAVSSKIGAYLIRRHLEGTEGPVSWALRQVWGLNPRWAVLRHDYLRLEESLFEERGGTKTTLAFGSPFLVKSDGRKRSVGTPGTETSFMPKASLTERKSVGLWFLF
jgi:hypothetical protein